LNYFEPQIAVEVLTISFPDDVQILEVPSGGKRLTAGSSLVVCECTIIVNVSRRIFENRANEYRLFFPQGRKSFGEADLLVVKLGAVG